MVECRTSTGWKKARALIDSGAELNLVSQLFVKEAGWQLRPDGAPPVEAADGRRMLVYGTLKITTNTADRDAKSQKRQDEYVSADISNYDMILGEPWLQTRNPDIDWDNKTWAYTENSSSPEPLAARAFFHAATDARRVYAVRYVAAATTEALSELPTEYEEYRDVFSEDAANTLPPRGRPEHAIEVTGDPPHGPIYNLSEKELKVLREYLQEGLERGWIRESTSPAGSPILFVPKKDGELRLCVDYRGLNKLTVKNRYPLPLTSEILDRLSKATCFTKLDLRNAYHRVRIREGDEWKTAFRTRYGHFEYLVMPFGLANAPATFQAYINRALVGLVDVTCIVYLDDILIYSDDPTAHRRHVAEVLERLRKHGLYAKLSKCKFNAEEVDFLGFVLGPDGIAMEHSRVQTIQDWPEPCTFREVQVFLGFANFYRRFIASYSKIAAPLTSMLKGSVNGRKSGPYDMTPDSRKAFRDLKKAFSTAPFLQHFDPEKPIRLETDASGFAIAGILSQQSKTDGHWHPVAFWSRKMIPAERNYETHDQELLAIVKSFRHWRHYLEGSRHPVVVMSDHANLRYFMTTKELSRRQARWAERLAAFDFEILYRKGATNPADGPSRRPDYQSPASDDQTLLLPTLQQKLRCGLIARRRRAKPVEPEPQLRVEGGSAEENDGGRHQEDTPSQTVDTVGTAPERDPVVSSTRKRKAPQPQKTTSEGTAQQMPKTGKKNPEGTVDETSTTLQRGNSVNPIVGTGGLEHLVPRWVATEAIATETAYGEPKESFTKLLLELQSKDPSVAKWKNDTVARRLRDAGTPKGSWQTDHKGLLRYNGAVYVPNDQAVRQEIMKINHDDPHGGHFGAVRTTELIRRKYFWPTIATNIKDYVRGCDVCQRTKAPRHRPYGELQSLPIPERPWKSVSMDMITGLPPSADGATKVYDAILVVVDRFTKMAKYLPTQKTLDAAGLANLFYKRIICSFGTPWSIVSDRAGLFTSQFWSSLCFYMKARRQLSTAFHPQTDGQTERQNQTLEHYLRCYVGHRQDDWVEWLEQAEFTYNNSKHASTGMTPFYAMYGYHPEFTWDVEDDIPEGEAPAAQQRAAAISNEREKLKERLRHAVEYQKKWYDKSHTPRHYRVGDKVLLSSKNIRLSRPSRKLDFRFLGPFRITEALGTQAYRLELPKTLGAIHPVFHVSLLEPYHRRGGEGSPTPPPAILMEDGEEYEVEAILDQRQRRGKPQYLVKWLGYPDWETSWEDESNLGNAKARLQEFKSNRPVTMPAASGRRPVKKQRRR
jgi:hypothetical protein